MGVLFKASRLNVLPNKASPSQGPFVAFHGFYPDAVRDLRWGLWDAVEYTTPLAGASKADSRTRVAIMGIPKHTRTGSVMGWNPVTNSMVTFTTCKPRHWDDLLIARVNAYAAEDNLKMGSEYVSWDYHLDDDDNDIAAAAAQVPPALPLADDAPGAGVIHAQRLPIVGQPVNIPAAAGLPIVGQPVNIPPAAGVPPPAANGPPGPAPAAGVGVGEAAREAHVGVGNVPIGSALPQLPAARRGRAGGTDTLGSLPPPPGNVAVLQVVDDIRDAGDRAALRRELDQRADWHDREYCFKVSVRAALRDRGESARTAILDELRQMLTKKVWHGVHVSDLTPAQRARILRMVTFLKDKYTPQNLFDKYKCRTCVDGSDQDHNLYENLSSPTATSTSVFSVAAIAATEGRHVMTVDIGGAFLHADIACTGVTVHVRLDKIMTQFLLELDSSYQEFICADGTCVVELDKALYGTIEAAKLWYDNISAKLVDDGFVPNPYDPCVFNRTNGRGVQTTVVLYVDDMLVTCVDTHELDKVATFLRKSYGEIAEHRGMIIDFLGMTFDFTTTGKVRVTMRRLIDEIIAGCGVTRERATPARENLFDVRDAPKLDRKDRDYFRSYTAKLLYLAKRIKPEMLTGVSFLTTRANEPDTDDLAKLIRALGYLLATRERGICLCIGETLSVQAFVDAAYGVHTSSGKSHSGCAVVLGAAGPVHVKSTKQKLVTKSSTEAELVALSDYASQAIWVRNFIIAQGYDVGPVVLHQDNMSCMALIKRGGPASERSRHISIRQFWVKEKIDQQEAVVKHLPTEKMFVNVMTKPLQGQQFIQERNALTNWD